jgi:hypothetical protein
MKPLPVYDDPGKTSRTKQPGESRQTNYRYGELGYGENDYGENGERFARFGQAAEASP